MPHSDYVKVEPLSPEEESALAPGGEAWEPKPIREPEMPIEEHTGTAKAAGREPGESATKSISAPSVAVYRFLVALSRSGSATGAYRLLRERGWLTSRATLYGGKSKPSILARAQSGGYIGMDGKMTAKGLEAIDPGTMIAGQGIYSGGEEHKELMRKTIIMIQDRGNLAFVPTEKDSFDVGEVTVRNGNAWDFGSVTAYECQTNAMPAEIGKCVARSKRHGNRTVFVGTPEVCGRIREQVGNDCETIAV